MHVPYWAIPIGAVLGCFGVAGGAFGAHALKAILEPDRLQIFEVAIRYQLYHALALLAVGILARTVPNVAEDSLGSAPATKALTWSARAFLLGVLLFSGSLFVLVFSGVRWIGAITPLGGVAFLVGWACLGYGGWQLGRPASNVLR